MQLKKNITTSLIIIFIFTVSACSPSGDTKESSLPVNTKYENFTTVKLTSGLYVSAFSERLENGEGRSEFGAYRFDGKETKQVFSKVYDSAYDARIEIRYNMQYLNQPVVLLRINYGAAAETIEVFGIKNDELILLQSLNAGGFDWHYQKASGKTLLVGIPDSSVDKEIYYTWNGIRFEQVTATL
jgi:hypothetical protein